MPIQHQLEPDSGILVSRATGRISPEDGLESHRHIARMLSENRTLKLLADMREADVAGSPAEVIGIIEAFYRIVGPSVPVAFITRADPEDPNPMLAEIQAYIDGGRLRVFKDEAAAREWLIRL